jgi:subtilisin family serine protease
MPSIKNILFGLSAVLPAVLAIPQINRVQTANSIEGKWIARLEDSELLDDVMSLFADLAGIQAKSSYKVGNVKGFNFDGDDAILDILQGMGAIKSVEPDFKVYASAPLHHVRQADNGTLVTQGNATWGLSRISHKEPGAKNYIYDASAGKDTFIYVIDTGINTEHSEFGGRATIGKSFIDGSDGEDDQGHGSHCSGTAAGKTFGVVRALSYLHTRLPLICSRRRTQT